jgi:hypothetical protein
MPASDLRHLEPKPRVLVAVDTAQFGNIAIATYMGRFVACGVFVRDTRVTLFARPR